MRKTMLTFTVGLVSGIVLGILLEEKDKKRIQEALGKQAKQLRKKYTELSQEGIDIVKDGFEKVKNWRKAHLE